MRKILSCLSALLLGATFPALGANQAAVTLHCLSLRFHAATAYLLGQPYSVEFTTFGLNDPANGELAPTANGSSSTHFALYKFYTPDSPDPSLGVFYLNIPSYVDLNGNQYNDFYEVSQAVNATSTSGTFSDALIASGAVTTVWSRAAGSRIGICTLTMQPYGLTFTHTFEIQEYDGTLTYDVADTNVTGVVALSQAALNTNTLAGPVSITQVNTNQVSLAAGGWTNAPGQTLAFVAQPQLYRYGTDYLNYLFFTDGDLTTAGVDYEVWTLSIDDLNDTNQNKVPDLSDPLPVARPPVLAAKVVNNQLALTIRGTVGRKHFVQATPSLAPINWATVQTVVLTNDPQVVTLTLPVGGTGFWRVTSP